MYDTRVIETCSFVCTDYSSCVGIGGAGPAGHAGFAGTAGMTVNGRGRPDQGMTDGLLTAQRVAFFARFR